MPHIITKSIGINTMNISSTRLKTRIIDVLLRNCNISSRTYHNEYDISYSYQVESYSYQVESYTYDIYDILYHMIYGILYHMI